MGNKQKKKRNKTYRGTDAATKPSVTKISAVNRNKLSQWIHDNKKIIKPASITLAVALALVWLVYELIRLASR